MAKLIYDGKGVVFGRLASVVAKNLLKGNSVDVINCEEIIVSGDKKLFAKKILDKREMGAGSSLKGPKYPRVADRLVKRMIRGMLPRDRMKGQDAFRRLRCHIGSGDLAPKGVPPAQMASAIADKVGKDELKNVVKLNYKKPMKYSSIKEIVRLLK